MFGQIGRYPFYRGSGAVDDGIPDVLNANTVAWYVASADNITEINDSLTVWNDISGNDYHLLSNFGQTGRPIFRGDSVIFDGDNDRAVIEITGLSQPHQIYAVIRQESWTDGEGLFSGFSNANGVIQQYGTTPNILAYSGGVSSELSYAAIGEWVVLRIVFSGASSKIQIDTETAVTGNFGTGVMDGIHLGRISTQAVYGNFSIKEFILRSIDDTDDDETAIYNYLVTKYGL
jgi:hypothetical protein